MSPLFLQSVVSNFEQNHFSGHFRAMQSSGSCQAVSGSHQTVVRQLSGSHQAVVRQFSGSRQGVVTLSSGCHLQSSGSYQSFIRQLSSSRQAVIRQSSHIRQAVVRQTSNLEYVKFAFISISPWQNSKSFQFCGVSSGELHKCGHANSAHLNHLSGEQAELAELFSWQLQNGPQDFDFFNCQGSQLFI